MLKNCCPCFFPPKPVTPKKLGYYDDEKKLAENERIKKVVKEIPKWKPALLLTSEQKLALVEIDRVYQWEAAREKHFAMKEKYKKYNTF